ncbi:MAG: FtsX-like permease family protein [Nitrospiraceae bacterium]|nr:FtsX-like permease family protein [Nitrospiraceae bacterium]
MRLLYDFLKLALGNIWKRKLRTFLTALEILIGVAAIVSLISLGNGFSESIQNQFNMMGADKIFVTPMNSFGSISNPFTTDDVNKIKSISGVSGVSYALTGIVTVSHGKEVKNVFVAAYPLDSSRRIIESMENLKVKKGRELKSNDDSKVVVGCDYTKRDVVFSKPLSVGDKLNLKGQNYRIVGVMDCIGDRMDDSSLLVTIPTAKKLLGITNQVYSIIVGVSDTSEIPAVSHRIERILFKSRHVNNDTKNFEIQTPDQIASKINGIFSVVKLVVLGIAAIALIVAIFGIMNTMYTSVTERVKDIGIMKAIGARDGDILLVFLIESAILGLIGGILGVGLGVGLAKVVQYAIFNYMGSNLLVPDFSPLLIYGSLIVSVLFGIIGGIFPAKQAARLRPVEAIRR